MRPALEYPTRLANSRAHDVAFIEELFGSKYSLKKNAKAYCQRVLERAADKQDKVRFFDKKTKELTKGMNNKDELAYLALFTFETHPEEKEFNAYAQLNCAMAMKDRGALLEQKDLLFGTLGALRKLPLADNSVLFRYISTKVDPALYVVGNTLTWTQFTSTSTTFGGVSKFRAESGTLFVIIGDFVGHDVKDFSVEGTGESEVLLEPCFMFRVVAVMRRESNSDIIIVEGLPSIPVLEKLLPPTYDVTTKKKVLRSQESPAAVEVLFKAVCGDADNTFEMGNMFFEGDSVPRDTAAGYEWWALAASHGHREANFLVGKCALFGLWRSKAPIDAKSIYLEQAKAGGDREDVKLLITIADLPRAEGPEYERRILEAAQMFARSTTRMPDRFTTALMLFDKVTARWNKDRELCKVNQYCVTGKAAEEGSAAEQFEVGNLYLKGAITGEPCYIEALRWITRAKMNGWAYPNLDRIIEACEVGCTAMCGDQTAMYRLAEFYRDGHGVMPNPTLSAEWFSRAGQSV